MTTKQSRRWHDVDDELLIFTESDQLLSDRQIWHDIGTGLLRSEALGVTLHSPRPIPLMEWRWPDQPPVQVGMVYAVDQDGPHPQRDAKTMNRTLPEVEAMARSGEWGQPGLLAKIRNNFRYYVCGASLVIMALMLWMTSGDPPAEETAPSVTVIELR